MTWMRARFIIRQTHTYARFGGVGSVIATVSVQMLRSHQ